MPNPHVLVVDDEPNNRYLAARFLSEAGYVVVTAADGEGALETLQGHGPFALYVLDIRMPGLDGIAVADRIRQTQTDPRILYFTAYSDELFSGARVLRECEAFVQKPVGKRELVEAASLLLYQDLQGPRD